MKKYLPLDTNNALHANFIELETYYNKGGYNVFTGEDIRRGYYVRCVPVNKSNGCISFIGFTGNSRLLEPTNRYSQKKMNSIDQSVFSSSDKIDIIINDNKVTELINHVLKNNNLSLA